jgi:DNA anti-recombination protein RmuC
MIINKHDTIKEEGQNNMADKNMNNVDQIRDLIFGSQLKEFDERFEALSKTLHKAEEKMLQTFKEAHTKLQRETERALEALEQKIDNLSTATQKERNKLKELIDTTDETLQTQMNNQKNEFLTKLKIMKENMEDENEKMNKNLSQMRSQIEAALDKGLADLGEEKLSRDAMAGMLLEVAMKIQGTDVNTLLTQEQKPETK